MPLAILIAVAIVAVAVAVDRPATPVLSRPLIPTSPAPSPTPVISQLPASSGSPLGLPYFSDMVVDDVHQHVFVTAGGDSNDIKVLDYDGHVVDTISGEPGASTMAIHDSTLYVNLSGENEIDRIDLGTERSIGPMRINVDISKGDLAFAGGFLWVGTGGCVGTRFDGVMSVDPNTGKTTSRPSMSFQTGCPLFVTSPFSPDFLLIMSSGNVGIYEVTGGKPIEVTRTQAAAASGLGALANDGTDLLFPGVGQGVMTCPIPSLEPAPPFYPTTATPTTVVEAAGYVIAAGMNYDGGKDLWAFREGTPQLVAEADAGFVGAGIGTWAPQSTIFGIAATGERSPLVFVVTGFGSPNDVRDTWFFVWRPVPPR